MDERLFNNPDLTSMLGLENLSQQDQQSILAALIRNLSIQGQLGSIDNNGMSGYSYGGRVGSSLPIGDGMFRAGIAGQGYRVKNPYDTMSEREITGGDLGYSWGNNDLSLSYDKQGGTGGVPLIQLLFQKYFD